MKILLLAELITWDKHFIKEANKVWKAYTPDEFLGMNG